MVSTLNVRKVTIFLGSKICASQQQMTGVLQSVGGDDKGSIRDVFCITQMKFKIVNNALLVRRTQVICCWEALKRET